MPHRYHIPLKHHAEVAQSAPPGVRSGRRFFVTAGSAPALDGHPALWQDRVVLDEELRPSVQLPPPPPLARYLLCGGDLPRRLERIPVMLQHILHV